MPNHTKNQEKKSDSDENGVEFGQNRENASPCSGGFDRPAKTVRRKQDKNVRDFCRPDGIAG